ncbi:suppressor of fused domain protein [Telmatocola sphagniphila]|uniref:Suppressor of fused domain protein n=1 Tax=Telmatocola sphagniphila TaxID=1123043 RepID=A0A8E6F0J6_9BACT|nr:suppressor of fused domain protein [Telmatocola sphagniphila]QVL34616.1 suppressor of fused domain protein [Telmatocola sphagniphila]
MKTLVVEHDWQHWWDNRLRALEEVFGPQDEQVFHSLIPFDVGGVADVLVFKHHLDGVVYVTADLIGSQEQLPTEVGNYELMMCHRGESEIGPNLISKLAVYTCEDRLKPGDTMNIERAAPVGSTVTALLFLKYADLTVLDQKAGVLLCMGITSDELDWCQLGRTNELIRALKKQKVYPFTEWRRKSVLAV